MRQITVTASRCYNVAVDSGVLSQIGDTVRLTTKAERICIVSDYRVFGIYGTKVTDLLQQAGWKVSTFVFPAGEENKNTQTYLQLLNFLADHNLSRTDCIIALGGGVVGDLAGFAAATYMRGIPYIQVPTTLLAMVDSSVGGKTAINLPAGKNLCGAFWQPVAVLCDTDTLDTLPEEIFRDGCAEVIKYGILFDADLIGHLEQAGLAFDREAIIGRCVELKKNVVAADELDQGQRKLLNLGHTFGHAIEACSNFTVSHGKAVAIGMAMAARSAKCPDAGRIAALLEQFRLPTTTELSTAALLEAACRDKKRSGQTVDLILPRAIGQCDIVPTPVESLKTLFEEGV